MQSAFKSITCTGLVHPGLKVAKNDYNGSIAAIDRDFLHLLDDFASNLFGGDFPQPSAPLGCEITVDSFARIVTNFAQVFKDQSEGMAIGLRDAAVTVKLMTSRDDKTRRFRDQLARIAPETAVVDPKFLERETDKLLNTYKEDFATMLKPWRMKPPEEERYLVEFQQALSDAVRITVQRNEQEIDGASMKIVAAPVVGFGVYFMQAHHIILLLAAAGGIALWEKKWAVRANVDPCSPSREVFDGMIQDARKWSLQRWKDIQAIKIVLERCTPDEAMDFANKARQKVTIVAAMSAASSSGGQQTYGTQARDIAITRK